MTGLAEIIRLPRGARFHRIDLHIHSFKGSHDVRDVEMTPENIVKTALAQGLRMVAITDHNEIENVSPGLKAAEGTELVVVPAVELSTPQGHLLAYLPSIDALQRFHSSLDLADRGTANSRCQNAIIDCLNKLHALGGFGILAHVDIATGFEVENPGGSQHKVDVICHRALLGIELKSANSDISYSNDDPDPLRVQAGSARIARQGLGEKQFLARLVFSDSHTLKALGRNAVGDKRVTRVKMDNPSFNALRIALDDCDARVRIEELVPTAVPHIVGVRFSGGFLDGQSIHFGQNLNCIIGGRGTGKSMTFEALRCLCGSPSDNSIIESEVWPAEVTLYWQDAAGQIHTVQKLICEDLVNLDDSLFGPVKFHIDCYGQGETARLSRRAESDPLALLEYLDKFVDLSDAIQAENLARDELLVLQSKIEESELKVALIPQHERNLAITTQQLAASEKAKASEVIQLQRKLATERAIRDRLIEDWTNAYSMIVSGLGKEKIESMRSAADPSELAIGGSELRIILTAAEALQAYIGKAEEKLDAEASKFDTVVTEQVRLWKNKDAEATRNIESKRKELEAQGVRLDMSFIQKLARDEANYKKSLGELQRWKPQLATLRRQRVEVLRQRWLARERVAILRDTYARAASQTLQSALADLKVTLKFVRNGCAPEAAAQIQEVMGWRTNQVPRATMLIERLTLPCLLQAIEKKDRTAITKLVDENGSKVFDSKEAQEILDRLGDQKIKFALERCAVHDLPRVFVTKKVETREGNAHYATREFSKLSLGQQQSILLSLLLASDGRDPLIIDQPEDNLDGEFIFSSFVPVLRRAKERRQIIIVTHNANIAVLGDAEQIVVLKSQSDHGRITVRGSIDDKVTRDASCKILEGAREAFVRRGKIYGIESPN